ncbi:MAG: tol-pal system protein YbgF [Pseudomonadota bacterium]
MPKVLTSVLTFLTLLSLFSCAPPRYAHRSGGDLAQMEKKLAETNEKLDKLYQQVSVLQLMVDSQQRGKMDQTSAGGKPPAGIKDLTSAGTKPPGGISEESTADMSTPPLVNEKKPLSPATQPPPPASAGVEEKRPGAATSKNLPEADALYQKAYGTFEKRQYQAAAELFDTVVARYPNHDLADNALYWAGECRYAVKDYEGALRSFMTLIRNYSNGNKVPDALLKAGLSYLVLGDTDNGVEYLKKVSKNFPFSTAAPKAEEKLKQLKIQ